MIMIMRAFLGLNVTYLVSRQLSQQTLQQINFVISQSGASIEATNNQSASLWSKAKLLRRIFDQWSALAWLDLKKDKKVENHLTEKGGIYWRGPIVKIFSFPSYFKVNRLSANFNRSWHKRWWNLFLVEKNGARLKVKMTNKDVANWITFLVAFLFL